MKSDRSADQGNHKRSTIMARLQNKLTDLQVRRRTRSGWMSDGGGLYLRISPEKHGGGRRWLLRYTFGGRKREMGLGDLDRVTLAHARDLRDEHIKQLKAGVDPLEAKRAAAQDAREAKQAEALKKTFAAAAESELIRRKSGWRKNGVGRPSSADTWHKSLIVDCVRIARRPVDEITAADVVAVVKPYWDKGALVSARRVWDRVRAVIDHAIAHEWRAAANPLTRERYEKLAPARPEGEQRHHAALKWEEMPAFIAKLREIDAMSSLALQMLAFTASRSNEVRGMCWTEIDWDAKVWTVPITRMKSKKIKYPHTVPLSAPALAILARLNESRASRLVFCGVTPDRPISNMSCYKVVRRLAGRDATVHGIRASFRSWCDENAVAYHVAEKALAHAGGPLDKAYRRSDMLEPRRKVMDRWAAFLDAKAEPVGEVVALGSRRQRS
jgi:integrase